MVKKTELKSQKNMGEGGNKEISQKYSRSDDMCIVVVGSVTKLSKWRNVIFDIIYSLATARELELGSRRLR